LIFNSACIEKGWAVFHIIYTVIADPLAIAGDGDKPFPEYTINFIS
jgi:hypothetical protein